MLVKCKECEKDISNKAISCPYCGCPRISHEGTNTSNDTSGSNDRICPRCGSTDLLYSTEESGGLNLYHIIMLVVLFCGFSFMLKLLIVYALILIVPIYILVRRYKSEDNLKITCKRCGCNVLEEQRIYEKMKAIADKSNSKSFHTKPSNLSSDKIFHTRPTRISNSSSSSKSSKSFKWKRWIKFYLICFIIILVYNSISTKSKDDNVRVNNESTVELPTESDVEKQSTTILDDLSKLSVNNEEVCNEQQIITILNDLDEVEEASTYNTEEASTDNTEESEFILESEITYGEPINVSYGDCIWGKFESTGDTDTDVYRIYVPEGTYRVTCKSNNGMNGLFKEYIEGYVNELGFLEYDNTTDFIYCEYNDVFTLEVYSKECVRLIGNSSFIFEKIN